MKYYSAIKSNRSESVLVRWMNLEPATQSEVSQKEKTKYCILNFQKREPMKTCHFQCGSGGEN